MNTTARTKVDRDRHSDNRSPTRISPLPPLPNPSLPRHIEPAILHPMDQFWHFARGMLRHRLLLVWAGIFAIISAGGLGVGLAGTLPILKNILGSKEQQRTLPELAAELNKEIAGTGVQIPQAWIDVLPTEVFNAVLSIMIALGVLSIFGATANFLHQYLSLTVVARTIANIRRDAFRRAVHLPLRSVLAAGPTDTVSRIVYDTSTLAAGFAALLSKAVAQVTKGIAALAFAFIVEWRLALISLVVGPVLGVIIRKMGKRIRRASKAALGQQAKLYQATTEALTGLRVVKVYAAERSEAGRFHRINKEVVKQELRARTAKALTSPLVEVLALFVLGGLSLVAIKAILDGVLDRGEFLAVMAALFVAAASLRPLTGILTDIQQSRAAAERLAELLNTAVEPGHDHKLPRLPRHAASIEFEHITFTYPTAKEPSLRNISLHIPFGQVIAFVGPNGCGKTTLLSLVPRLFDPDAGDNGDPTGRVLVDGRDIRDYGVRSLRRQIGVVTQDTVLFAGTIRSNIAYAADSTVSDQQIRDAARRARAEEFILAKPKGYDDPIGEGGSGLSGGQRQRLAIARAILRDPAILILDEATSMIDSDSEAKIAEAIAEFVSGARKAATPGAGESKSGRTCLIVAHRLSTVINADRIVVMDAGRIVDQGRHEELMGRCELYRQLARNQLGRGEGESGAAA
jgi:ATP-binding cassette, subfamily B, bacterial MsbA